MLFRELWARFQCIQRYNLNFIASLNDVTIKQSSLEKVERSSIVFYLFLRNTTHFDPARRRSPTHVIWTGNPIFRGRKDLLSPTENPINSLRNSDAK